MELDAGLIAVPQMKVVSELTCGDEQAFDEEQAKLQGTTCFSVEWSRDQSVAIRVDLKNHFASIRLLVISTSSF
jgi:hypothetical protein